MEGKKIVILIIITTRIIFIVHSINIVIYAVLSSWLSHCESSPGSFHECRLSAGWPSTLRPIQWTWAVQHVENWLLSSAFTIAIVIITQSVSCMILILEGSSRPRHCSKGAQPAPEAVYRSGCRDR